MVTSRPSVSPPTDSRMRSNRPRSWPMSDATSSAPSSRSPAALAEPLPTSAVTSAPPRCASWIANRPTPPEAPVTSTRRPRMAGPSRSILQPRQAGRRERRALGEGDAIGQPGDPSLRGRHPLGPGLAFPEPDHSGAGPKAVLDVGQQDAGEVPTRSPAVSGRPEHPQLAPIDRERANLDERLAGRGHRLGSVANGDPARSRAVSDECAHRLALRGRRSSTTTAT